MSAGYCTEKSPGGQSPTRRAANVVHAHKSYEKVQCIAYEISSRPTGMETVSTADDFYKGLWAKREGPCFEDARARADFFKEALEAAAASDTVDNSPNTLKVFMAPEFLLRGPRGAYQFETLLGNAAEPGLFKDLAELVKGEKWSNWLVVFGTVVGYTEEPSNGNFPCYNCACLQLGGWTTEEERNAGAIAVAKTFKSGIDFLKDPAALAAVSLSEVEHMNYDSASNFIGFQELDGDGVFEIGGITFGVEICLDHACQRLKLSTPEPGNNVMQVQLVPSCGMSVQFKSIAVQKGGICFGCDGLSSGFDGQPETGAATHSQVYVVPSGPAARFKQKSKGGENTYLKKTYLDEKTPAAGVSPHGEDWKKKLGDLYDVSVQVPPQIKVYESLPVPPPISITAS